MVQIPDDKRYFRIGEASRIIGVEPYVLRYWESEFSQVRPELKDLFPEQSEGEINYNELTLSGDTYLHYPERNNRENGVKFIVK